MCCPWRFQPWSRSHKGKSRSASSSTCLRAGTGVTSRWFSCAEATVRRSSLSLRWWDTKSGGSYTGFPLSPFSASGAELDGFRRLWERETALNQNVLLLDCEGLDPVEGARLEAARRFLDSYRGPLFLVSRQRQPMRERPVFTVDVEKPTPVEQKDLWMASLGDRAEEAGDVLDTLVAQFHLGAHLIRSASEGALALTGVGMAQ